MADLDVARSQDMLAGTPGVRAPASVGSQVGNVAPEHGTARERPRFARPTARRTAPPHKGAPRVDPDVLAEQLDELNRKAKPRHLRFEISYSSEEIAVRVIDDRTGMVLRTIPPAALAQLQEHALSERGLVVDAHS
jgi:uncharacterized FlaG/YvyC family protein